MHGLAELIGAVSCFWLLTLKEDVRKLETRRSHVGGLISAEGATLLESDDLCTGSLLEGSSCN